VHIKRYLQIIHWVHLHRRSELHTQLALEQIAVALTTSEVALIH
jgi:hypothetical protein